MYVDIDPANWEQSGRLAEGSLVDAIVCGRERPTNEPLYASEYEIDTHQPADRIVLASDADSSQHSALCDIAQGNNLVIEGPPGTGKSQTITNAIASALHEGKSVLFVAEKLAALKVVQEKLTKLGIGDFCLELHSEAASPKRVYDSLRSRVNSHFPPPSEIDGYRRQLETEKFQLAEYLRVVDQIVGPFQEPVYELLWRVIDLRARGIRSLRRVKYCASIDSDAFNRAAQMLEVFAETIKEVESPGTHPWRGFHAIRLNPNDCEPIQSALQKLQGTRQSIDSLCEAICNDFGNSGNHWLVSSFSKDFTLLNRLAGLPFDTTFSRAEVLRSELSRGHARAFIDLFQRWQTLSGEVNFITVGNTDIANAAESLRNVIRTRLLPVVPRANIGFTRQLSAWLNTLTTILVEVDKIVQAFEAMGLGLVRNIQDYERADLLFRLIRHPIITNKEVLRQEMFWSSAATLFNSARRRCKELLEQRSKLEVMFSLDSAPEYQRVREIATGLRRHANSRVRWFQREYRYAKRELAGFWRPEIGKTPFKWVSALEELDAWQQQCREFNSNSEYRLAFGDAFRGLRTDWDQLKTLLNWVATAKNHGIAYAQAFNLLSLRNAASDLNQSQVISIRNTIKQQLNNSEMSAAIGIEQGTYESTLFEVISSRAKNLLSAIAEFDIHSHAFVITSETNLSVLVENTEKVLAFEAAKLSIGDSQYWHRMIGDWHNGSETDIGALASAVDWVEQLANLDLTPQTIDKLLASKQSNRCEDLAIKIRQLQNLCKNWGLQRDSLADFGTFDDSWLDLVSSALEDFGCRAQLNLLQANIDQLPAWSSLCRVIGQCRDRGLDEFIQAAIAGAVSPAEVANCYQLTVLERVSEQTIQNNPCLSNFSRQRLEKARLAFQQCDRKLLELNRRLIANYAAKAIPPAGNSRGRVAEFTEMGLVRHEIQKQTKFCRIRDLFSRAGHATRALKPCFMMSPLSVAQFLAPEGIEFDLVIMDEASQIKPEDAIGTILRAKQLVVVGDPKQLPPTSFFQRVDEDVDDEAALPLDNTESILESAMKSFPARRLRWHYRSQHESLIHFSNDRFYENDLVIFPSATTNSNNLGIRYHQIENGKFTDRGNIVEAAAVAAAIADHARRFPNESLGVGTFNLNQRVLIEDCLEKVCQADTSVREAVNRLSEGRESLFVKNLENLQGDERDVIFISYTYGPDPESGRVMNRFGPITGEFGWRRLNVLITRARKRIHVFSSMSPAEILGGPGKSKGVNSMKDYLEFAQTGKLPNRGVFTGREADSPFECSVARVITGLGLKVVPQVGVAGYFIDIGVLRPGSEDEFLIGIECDGATYHSVKSARDRDRLREEVIRSRGWNLHRIWSTDWFLNQHHEEKRLQEAINSAIAK
jgi:very-short-patch-repair endonuclease